MSTTQHGLLPLCFTLTIAAAKEAIGFVGMGRMGRPMVRNIIKAGISVTGFARDSAKAPDVAALGVQVVDSLAKLAEGRSIIVSMVTDDNALEDVLFGSGNLAHFMKAGNIFLSMSFNSPECVARTTERLHYVGIHFVNAPVFGRPEAADAARLLVVAAGSDSDIARCQHVFDAVGRKTLKVGKDPRNGAITKLIGNFLVATIIEGFSEAAVLGKKSGLSDSAFVELVQELFPSGGLPFGQYAERITSGTYDQNVGAAVSIGLKDLGLMRAQATAVACPLPLADIHHEHLRELQAKGREHWDWTGVAAVVADHAGITLGEDIKKPEQ